MSFVSYAQNFEDVMLWRALKHIKQGFYIDVGAWSPDADSVTRAFYERGWNGINIEPNLELRKQLLQRRPRDINLTLAVSDTEGSVSMSFLANSGLSTLDTSIAQLHLNEGRPIERQAQVQVVTLNTVWQLHTPENQEVHFLKVDVEGLEDSVLRGKDWTSGRPWIVVVEATRPMSQEPSYASWEPVLLAARYRFVYADGLNRFYVANEHAELNGAFTYPPNVFDGFVSFLASSAEEQATQAISRADAAEEKAAQALLRADAAEYGATIARNRIKVHEAQIAAFAARITAIEASSSWRLTAPLRAINNFLKSSILLIRHGPRHNAIAILRSLRLLGFVKTVVRGRPNFVLDPQDPSDGEITLEQLSPEARQIYFALRKATTKTGKPN
jgi:FkbM family methyltransferase